MALTLMSVLVALAMNAIHAGISASRAAAERRVAAAEAEYRLLTEWPKLGGPGERSGRLAGEGAWRVSARLIEPSDAGPGLCQVTSTITTSSPRRRFAVETYRFCRRDTL